MGANFKVRFFSLRLMSRRSNFLARPRSGLGEGLQPQCLGHDVIRNEQALVPVERQQRGYGRGPGRPVLTEIEVVRAAEALLREGKRPTVAAVRERTGGSNGTVAPLLDAWWRSFSSRIAE